MSITPEHRSGTVAIVGRPNVGKSTLINRIIGQKVSITSAKPQTTRHRILGVLTRPGAQLALLDTPGFQIDPRASPMARVMNRTVSGALEAADVIVMVSSGLSWTGADARMAAVLPGTRPALLAINKIDRLGDATELLPLVDRLRGTQRFDAFLPISAQSGQGVESLIQACIERLPPGPPGYDADTLTDRSERFIAAELIREKLFRLVGDEVPYASTVVIDQYVQTAKLRTIHATIMVERAGHQPIVLGPGGARIKRIGTEARVELERMFGGKVFLQLWVKRKQGWAQNEQSLRAYGYE